MDNSISPNRPDVVSVETTARPTATPARVNFSDVLAGGARALVQGAQAAASVLPGAPLIDVYKRQDAVGPPSHADVVEEECVAGERQRDVERSGRVEIEQRPRAGGRRPVGAEGQSVERDRVARCTRHDDVSPVPGLREDERLSLIHISRSFAAASPVTLPTSW